MSRPPRMSKVFEAALGADAVRRLTGLMGAEDFGELGLRGKIPVF
jgi:hypothetical protein